MLEPVARSNRKRRQIPAQRTVKHFSIFPCARGNSKFPPKPTASGSHPEQVLSIGSNFLRWQGIEPSTWYHLPTGPELGKSLQLSCGKSQSGTPSPQKRSVKASWMVSRCFSYTSALSLGILNSIVFPGSQNLLTVSLWVFSSFDYIS